MRDRPIQVMITPEQIQKRVDEVALEITRVYGNEPITIVGVLTGCLVFLSDLIRRLEMPLRIALIQASSYRGTDTTAGRLKVQDDLLPDLRGRHLLILDDILDTGQTLGYMVGHMNKLGAASVRVAVLLRKIGRQSVPLEPDFFGFEIPDAFVVGYGLDFDDEYRNLPYIGVLGGEGHPPA